MPDCELIQECSFFNSPKTDNMPRLFERLKSIYCQGDCSKCARYDLFQALGGEVIPTEMLPNQHDWARQILLHPKKLHD